MSKPTKYLLVSFPTSITPSHHRDDALDAVSATVAPENGSVAPFPIPEFKIGTLDALVQQADELAKLETACQVVVSKVGDALKNILEGDEAQISKMKAVNDKPVDQYLRTFTWNKVKYRADKSLGELIDLLQKEAASIDNDIRSKYSQYNQVKTTLATLQRKQTGNLATKSLASVVDPRSVVQNSEYLETHLVAVPAQQVKEFLKTYETVSPMVVPRSATFVASDDEFTLYAVTTFKKHSLEFVHKAREHKWIPREFKYVEGGKEEERREVERVGGDERKLWGETLRLGRTAWSEAVMVWIHVLVLRVFVETVLRYGLPLDFVCTLIRTPSSKQADKAKHNLDEKYSYLAGNAFGRDKKGRVKKDDPSEDILDWQIMVMDMHLRLFRFLVRSTDTGELRNLTRPGQLIKTLGVTLLGNLNGDIDEDLNEGQTGLLTRGGDFVQFARGVTVCTVGRDERGDGNGGAVGEELGNLCNPTDVLVAVLFAKTEVLVESEADVVTVETVGVDTPVSEELVLELNGNGRLARGGETGEPDCETALVAEFAAFAARHSASVEGNKRMEGLGQTLGVQYTVSAIPAISSQ
ncbi:hypothetical protein BDV39DRAFT_194337 [Aspergillus sergii]|uniref:V-type proton ATPase subunit C n=1 Tax=Aspergillus sergii TaxID=1034303 RepID=A0A5N6WX98_9EURO|nr:hypothetical protein BDV39DRAFT_194337 [Aspergillus sergii]